MFIRYSLRTTDLDGALAFYENALGLVLPEGSSESSSLEAWTLHENARDAGAPSHWLGHIEVEDIDASVQTFTSLGATLLGPMVRTPDGRAWATFRDPSGAVVALRQRQGFVIGDRPVAWHQLHTEDLKRIWPAYQAIARWSDTGHLDITNPVGGYRLVGEAGSRESVGCIANTARWEGVHPHWLFYFPAVDIDAAVARVRANGGTALEPVTIEGIGCVAACEDPQGAAFGLIRGS